VREAFVRVNVGVMGVAYVCHRTGAKKLILDQPCACVLEIPLAAGGDIGFPEELGWLESPLSSEGRCFIFALCSFVLICYGVVLGQVSNNIIESSIIATHSAEYPHRCHEQ